MSSAPLPAHKTKIVATIGPASAAPEVLEAMLQTGMNVARLNFSHGDFADHARLIANLRAAAAATARPLTLMADLPGPKIRIGNLARETIQLEAGSDFTLTTQECVGDASRVWVSFARLPEVVAPGNKVFLNDGLVQLEVVEVRSPNVRCRVLVGGELRSRKGLNLPGLDLGIAAFTPRDAECLRFALEQGVHAISQSFVESATDVEAVRAAAAAAGQRPFILAKIERARALERIDEILDAADGIMIARGDLGVEVPIEGIAMLQKDLLRRAVRAGKPVITATQMLESMLHSRSPTRAEATDVANAILDGTDAVMLSGESALGRYPVEAVGMLARIAAATEPHRARENVWRRLETLQGRTDFSDTDLLTLGIEAVLSHAQAAAVVVPTRSGATARSIARLRLPVWILAATESAATRAQLGFSYGVHALHVAEPVADWSAFSRAQLAALRLAGDVALLVEGPSPLRPQANHAMEILDLQE